jgi:hypothetical protein
LEFHHDRPYFEVFRALQSLQGMEDLTQVYDTLAEKLSRLFDDIPEKEGCKTVRHYSSQLMYYHTGICSLSNSYKEFVLLSPWESEWASALDLETLEDPTEEQLKKMARTRMSDKLNPTAVMRSALGNNRGWYYQYAMHHKRTIKLEPYYLDNILNRSKTLEQLDPTELKLLGLHSHERDIAYGINNLLSLCLSFSNFNGNDLYGKSAISAGFFLSDGNFTHLDNLISKQVGRRDAEYAVVRYLQNLTPTEDNVQFSIASDHIFTPNALPHRSRTYLPSSQVISYLKETVIDKTPGYRMQQLLHKAGLFDLKPSPPEKAQGKKIFVAQDLTV